MTRPGRMKPYCETTARTRGAGTWTSALGDEVRRRFDASYAAKIEQGRTVRDDYGMWVMLDAGDDQLASQVGHGLGVDYPAIARFTLDELEAHTAPATRVMAAEAPV